jgi:hypothetical protein
LRELAVGVVKLCAALFEVLLGDLPEVVVAVSSGLEAFVFCFPRNDLAFELCDIPLALEELVLE